MKTVALTHHYAVPPERLWALVTDYGALEEVMTGIIAFEGMPAGRVITGQKIDVMVSLFGKLPAQPYHMEVLECDDVARVLRSSEHGAGVKSWRHTLRVDAHDGGSVLSEQIEIDAGLLTPLFAAWARYLYKARHKPRLALLARGAF